ncbi:MAG: arginine N-succinyltransferase [Sphingobium sp.]
MSLLFRPVRADDVDALYAMAKSTGGGFTNLAPDRDTLEAKVTRALAAFDRAEDAHENDQYVFMLEDVSAGRCIGTCQIFAKIGAVWPFYSFRVGALTQYSKELERTFRAEMLTLSTDLDGATEVGGLFLLPTERSSGAGALLARARYLFIKMHRARFADRTIAELRGVQDDAGSSPFWDGMTGRFFGMSFREADEFNAIHGNQFIADLIPKHPIYTAMIPDSARAAIGMPHTSGRAAMRMLEKEGFVFDNYIDVFDGGPAMIAPTDKIATVAQARADRIAAFGDRDDAGVHIVAHGRLNGFRACYGAVEQGDGEGVVLDPAAGKLLGVAEGDAITHVAR